jgi:hypothetical protein
MVDRDTPHVFTIRHQPVAAVAAPGIAAGCAAHEVSTNTATGASSLLVRFDPGWRFDGECTDATELFVLRGTIVIDGAGTLSAGGYCHLSAGAGAVRCSSASGAEAFVFRRPDPATEVAGALVLASFALPWESTVLPGFPAGAMHKSLRPQDATGAAHGGPDGFLRLVLPPPGWLSPHEERHAGCWEENILLRGDMLMPGRGTIRAGDCLANPAGHWHGPMVTKGGALFLVNCDTPMGVEYRDHPPGAGELERYLETAPWE